MSGGGGKGGSGASGYDYYGSLVAAICRGPVDVLHSVIVGGNAIWEDTDGLARGAENYVDLTGSIEPKYFHSGSSYLHFYWGTATQTADAESAAFGHPDYKNVCYLVAKGVLFGRETTMAPNIEIVCGRKPVCDESLCAAEDNILDDGQANPVAVLGELMTSVHGLGLPVEKLDSDSWLAAGAYCATNKANTFCSPLLTAYDDARTSVSSLLSMFQGALAWTTTGTLSIKLLKYGVDPGGLATLDASFFTERPKLSTGSWGDVPTGIVARYVDRDRKFKDADEKVDNLVSLRIRGEDQRKVIDLPHVLRRAQAVALASQAVRRMFSPPSTATLVVRRELGSYFPGDKVKFDADPEPGGDGLAQLGIVKSRSDAGVGAVTLEVECDPLASTAPYTPPFDASTPTAPTVASIANALIVPLNNASFGVLAARPDPAAVGFRVFFDTDEAGSFAELGLQPGFAVRCSLDSAIDAAADVVRLTLLDGENGPDAYLAGRTGGSEIEAQRDVLLVIIANVDGDGRIIIDGDGALEMEFLSVVSRTAVDADTHDYTVLRGRDNTFPAAWTTGAQVWLIPGTSLVSWTHELMLTLIQTAGIGYVRLSAYSAVAEDESTTLPQFTFLPPTSYINIPVAAWTTPADDASMLDGTGNLTPAATMTDSDGNLVRVQLFSTRMDTGIVTTLLDYACDPTGSISLATALAAAGVATPFNFAGDVAVDLYYQLRLRMTDKSGNVQESIRTVIRAATGGGGGTLGGITFTPAGGNYTSVQVTLDANGTSATKIHYVVGKLGLAQPVSGWTVVNATTIAFGQRPSSHRIWARASDGTNHSAWQYQDYT
jgi:hypothetical protein